MQVNWDPYLLKKCNPSGDEPASWEGTLTSQEMDLVIQMDVSAMQPPGNLIPPEIAINVVEKQLIYSFGT